MKYFTTSKGRFFLLNIKSSYYIQDEDGIGFFNENKIMVQYISHDKFYRKTGYRDVDIISKVSDLTEEQASRVVDEYKFGDYIGYKNYMDTGGMDFRDIIESTFKKSIKSFSTLLESLSITDTTNWYLFNILG